MPTLVGKKIGPIGLGLMGFTWGSNPTPYSEAIKTMKAALEAGANFWNGGDFYGTPNANSLHLLNAYFTQYPEDADKVVLSIKSGLEMATLTPVGDRNSLMKSIDNAMKILDGKKKVDIFQCARVDRKTPIEETIATLAEFLKEGKIGGIGLSEVSAATIRRANQVYSIAAVEVEFSLFSTDILTNDVAATCAEFGNLIVAYSPLGRGFLTGQIKSFADVTEIHKISPRFQEENFQANLDLAKTIRTVAERKGCTPSQLAIGWVKAYSGGEGCPTIVPLPGSTNTERTRENSEVVDLTFEEMKDVGEILEKMPVKGSRVRKAAEHLTWG